MNFSSIPPVVTIAPANKTEANAAPTAEGLEPGNAVVKLMGVAAQIGEFQEVWWALPGDAFTVDVGGNIYPDLRKAFFRLDTPGARLINRGGAYSCDWTDAHDLLRQKRWLRVDPILRDLGVCPDGLLSASQWKHPAEHAKVAEALCSPKALASIAQLNGVEWSESAAVAMPYRLGNVIAPALEKILRQSEKHRAQSNLEKNAARWQEALRGANAILQGDAVDPEPFAPPEQMWFKVEGLESLPDTYENRLFARAVTEMGWPRETVESITGYPASMENIGDLEFLSRHPHGQDFKAEVGEPTFTSPSFGELRDTRENRLAAKCRDIMGWPYEEMTGKSVEQLNLMAQRKYVPPAPVEDTNPEPEAVAAPVESSETPKHPRGRRPAAPQEG